MDLYLLRDIPQPQPRPPTWGLIWPPPQQFRRTDGSVTVAATFAILSTHAASPRLQRAIARYEAIVPRIAAAWRRGVGGTAASASISRLVLKVSTAEALPAVRAPCRVAIDIIMRLSPWPLRLVATHRE